MTSSTRKTLNLVVGFILVNSNKKLKKSDVATMMEKKCTKASMIGNSFDHTKLGRTNCVEMKVNPATSTN